jgi:hypothetical protein
MKPDHCFVIAPSRASHKGSSNASLFFLHLTENQKGTAKQMIENPTTSSPKISTLTECVLTAFAETTDRPDRRQPPHLRSIVSDCKPNTLSQGSILWLAPPGRASLSPSSPSASLCPTATPHRAYSPKAQKPPPQRR